MTVMFTLCCKLRGLLSHVAVWCVFLYSWKCLKLIIHFTFYFVSNDILLNDLFIPTVWLIIITHTTTPPSKTKQESLHYDIPKINAFFYFGHFYPKFNKHSNDCNDWTCQTISSRYNGMQTGECMNNIITPH